MDLITLAYDTLIPLGYPTIWQERPTTFPGITYHFFGESGELYGDGNIQNESVSCQIDIWVEKNANTVSDYNRIKKEVKSAMKEAGFLFSSATDSYEDEVKLYHCVLIFNFYYESEE